MGRKTVSTSSVGKAVTAARSVSRQAKQKGDVTRSKETVEAYQDQLAELEKALKTDIDNIADKLDAKSEDVASYEVKPLKRDCVVKALSLTWEPMRRNSDGSFTRAWS
ncbi:MAG: hypothetical protein PHP79_10645 [Clostridia bacterium]|nr:hypothetical protein [Clostridia bacterium]